MDAAVALDRARRRIPARLVIFETTLPVGDTRGRYAPAARGGDAASPPSATCSSRSRPSGCTRGAALRNLATYPKLVGGIGPAVDRARRGVLRVGPRRRSRRDELTPRRPSSASSPTPRTATSTSRSPTSSPRYADADRRGHPRGHPRSQQPAVQPHPPAGPRGRRPLHPGLSALPPVAGAGDGARRGVPAGQRRAGRRWRSGRSPTELGGLGACPVLVLGLTYREGVKELAYSRAMPLIERLAGRGRAGLGVGPAAVGRGDRALGRDALDLGHGGTHARSSPRPPTRLSGASTRRGSRGSR